MSEPQSPTAIAREAKSIHQGLKEALKKNQPFDRDIDFQRKNLRRRYLSLLLVHPYAKETHDAENHLWMQTSYLFISSYKQHISALDRILASHNIQQQNGHGPVEYRKLVQRFRQFLADEEKFWTQLVLRFCRSFALEEAHPTLAKLGLDPKEGLAEGRNHFQFPTESGSVVPSSDAQRESRLSILSKALVCLGDIARYRELYNDGGGRSKIGHDDTPRRGRGNGRRAGIDIVRPRNYARARSCYEQAKLLVPTDGNPSHQLAILASYEKDQFMSMVHYYFALCVKQPYDTAADNMGTIMGKALEQWKARPKEDKDAYAADPPVGRVRIDKFKEKMLVLHALWRLGLQKMDSLTRKESNAIYIEFKSLLSERHLPEEFIPQILVTAQGALYKHRMLRDNASKKSKDTSPTLPQAVIEKRILNHLLLLHRALLEIGLEQIASVDQADEDLAQRITAPFRRTLGALRMSMKWLRANMKTVLDQDNPETGEFWRVLTEFADVLARTFPAERLPELTSALEEDRDLEGFTPLKGLFVRRQAVAGEHPNVVHLMRISDILQDVQLVAELENSPLKVIVPSAIHSVVSADNVEERDDEVMTETTDDPVADAFGHLNEQDMDDDDEEEVVYPRASVSPPPRHSPITPVTPSADKVKLSPIGFPVSPAKLIPVSPVKNISPQVRGAVTAQDLLFSDVLGPKRPSTTLGGDAHRAFFPQDRSIWATASDEPLRAPRSFGADASRSFGADASRSFGGDASRSFGVDASRSFGTDVPPSLPPLHNHQSQTSWPPQLSSSSQLSSQLSSQTSTSTQNLSQPGYLPPSGMPFNVPPMVMDHMNAPPPLPLSNMNLSPNVNMNMNGNYALGMGMGGGPGMGGLPSSMGPNASYYQPPPPPLPQQYRGPEQYYSSSPIGTGHGRTLSMGMGMGMGLAPPLNLGMHEPRSVWGPTG